MTPSQSPAVELYVRSLSSYTGQTERIIERARRLAADGEVSDLAVTVWGDEVELSTTAVDTPPGKSILDTVSTVRAWADDNDVSVEPFFRHRETHSTVTGETYATLRLPSVMVVERVDGELVHVAPHESGGTTLNVPDRLAALATERPERVKLHS